MWWKIGFSFGALISVADAIMAFSSFDHFGDMHISWGGDALIAAGVFLVYGWRK